MTNLPAQALIGASLDDFVLEVPRQYRHVNRPRLHEALRQLDRDVRAGGELDLFAGIPVDRKIEKVAADATVVQQRIALPWRDLADHRHILFAGVNRGLKETSLDRLHLGLKRRLTFQAIISLARVQGEQLADPRTDWLRHIRA